ncbi:MAG: PfkB family carbohydrate kinase [Mariprofundaceae bacterium]
MADFGRPIIFGEVLFDRFPDQSSVLGGAPFNVAWHLQGFGLDPFFISRVGNDAPGKQIIQAMHDWGMATSGLQIDTGHATGAVEVAIRNGQPAFDIVPDQAYDHIDAQAALRAIGQADYSLIYHGSLIARNDVSRRALTQLRQNTRLPSFVDLNLRPPWCDSGWIDSALKTSRWIKVNDIELAEICQQTELESDSRKLEQEACKLQQALGLDMLIVTRGADGALLVDKSGRAILGKPVAVAHMADTVGAGDSFSSVMLLGLLRGWPLDVSLNRAAGFAAGVCAMRGATGFDRNLYSSHLAEWESADE